MPDRQTPTDRRFASDPTPGVRAESTRQPNPSAPPEQATDDAPGSGPDRPAEPIEERDTIEEREPFPAWPPRDILAPFVLLAVSLQRSHGYVIEDYLRALGLFGITMSTLYRTLRQMERDGFLVSTWEPGPTGPARRVYTITAAGQTVLGSSAAMLDAYRTTIDRFFGLYDAGPGATRRPAEGPTPDKENAP